MHRYVAVEVKVDKFDSDNVGQLGLYQKAINEQPHSPGTIQEYLARGGSYRSEP